MADEGCGTAVVLLCGIPASGKSTLAKKVQQYVQKTRGDALHVIHVCYDDYIPSDLDVNDSIDGSQVRDEKDLERITDKNNTENSNPHNLYGNVNSPKYSLWKQYRKRILEVAERVLNMIEFKDNVVRLVARVDEGELHTEGLPSFQEFWENFQKRISSEERNCSCITSSDCRWNGDAHLVLVDDNMYYHSMRYEYVQLARKYGTGFAEVFLECPLEVALKRNRARSDPVSSHTMEAMFKKMELPEPDKFPWEQYYLILKAEDELNIATMEKVTQLALEALKHPVTQTVEENYEEKEMSRLACITSIIHQADQVLRKYITRVIAEAKGSGKGKKELQSLASKLNKEKKVFMESLHNIKSQPECSNKIKKTVPPVVCFIVDNIEKRVGETSEDVTPTSDGSTEITSKPTINPNHDTNGEENDQQDCSAKSIELDSCSETSTMHLCLHCLPNVDDKEEFRLVLERLFKNITNLKENTCK